MRAAIIADIHGNSAALEAVLEDIQQFDGIDAVWCLGDIVGYGAEPCKCIETVRGLDALAVAGNHDWAAIGKLDIEEFNSDAAIANKWTGMQLGPDEIDYLSNLPLLTSDGDFTLVHGSPRDPIWEYVVSDYAAAASFDHFDSRFCLVGHSHVPLVFEDFDSGIGSRYIEPPVEGSLALGEGRLIVNPGSVGQPRDGDPRASYAVWDSCDDVVLYRRVAYDVSATQRRMAECRLPERLAARLAYGW